MRKRYGLKEKGNPINEKRKGTNEKQAVSYSKWAFSNDFCFVLRCRRSLD